MFPIRSQVRVPTRPWVAYAILAGNAWVFWLQMRMPPAQEQTFVASWGVTPYWLLHSHYLETWLTPLTSMFIHGGLLHFLSNMWFLLVFSAPVEHGLGRTRFFVNYIVGGLLAVVAQVAASPMSRVPMVGASGAIASVLGAYWVLYRHTRIIALVPIFIFLQFMEIPAFIFIAIWFLTQLLMAFGGLANAGEGGVAFFAHLGGFISGVWFARYARAK